MSWKSSTAVVHKLSGVEIDTALIRIAKQHRWITSASFTAGVLSARIRQAEWPLTVDQHNIIHMARAAAIIDQLCRVAIHASVKWGDDESWGTIRHTADEHANMIPSFEKLELWINPEDYAGRMTRSRVRAEYLGIGEHGLTATMTQEDRKCPVQFTATVQLGMALSRHWQGQG
ncbi:MAG: hypothetical protein H6812_04420 [Phycisphaeraceae bacterium]|nr:hypothetical protein [Phycisphaerales bacterium]MCB9842482.1 hypothetical protein [Phycisphaeraceae bacterium]